MSGCSQEDALKSQSSSADDKVFTASFEAGESRTQIENGYLLRWTENDLISLFVGNTLNCQYQFDGKTGDNGGSFSMVEKASGTGTDLETNYAVYPYSEDLKMSSMGIITATLPAQQSYAPNSFGLTDDTMVAVTRDTEDTFLHFKNVGGYLKLQLYADDVTVKSITLTGNNREKLAGKASITAVYDENPIVSMASDAAESITLDCGNGVKLGNTAETATAFWLVVPPTSFEKGITVVVKDIHNKEYTQSTAKKLVIERNVVKRMVAKGLVNLEEKPDSSNKLPYPEYVMPCTQWGLSMDEVKEMMSDYKLVHQDSQKLVYENENPYIVISYEFASGKLYLASRYSNDANETDYNSFIQYIHRAYQEVREHGTSHYWDEQTRTFMQISGVETTASKNSYTCFSWVGIDWME
jgi:hypothetical protein